MANSLAWISAGSGVYNPGTDTSVVEWLNGDAITGAVDGGHFGTWQHSTGQDATQANVAFWPIYRASINPNGIPGGEFITSATVNTLATASFGTLTQPYAVWVRFLLTSQANTVFIFDSSDGANRAAFYYGVGAASYHGFAGNDVDLGLGGDITTWHSMYLLFNGASSKWAIDGGSQSTYDAGSNSLNGLTLANKFDQSFVNSACKISEIFVQNAIPSNVAAIFAYLAAR